MTKETATTAAARPRLRSPLGVAILRSQPDRRLVKLAAEGNQPAFEEIVKRYRPALVLYAAGFVSRDRAEDVVQVSLAKADTALRGATAEIKLRPWLYRIVHNTALNAIRDEPGPHEQIDDQYDGVPQPPDIVERREQFDVLVNRIQALPRRQREAIVKRELEGRSHDEIGAALALSPGAVRQLIYRARQGLREGLGAIVPIAVVRALAASHGELEASGAGLGLASAGTGGGAAIKVAAVVLVAAGSVATGHALRHHGEANARGETPVASSSPKGSGDAAATGGGEDGAERGDGGSGRDGPGPTHEAEHESGEGESHHGGRAEPGEHSGTHDGGEAHSSHGDGETGSGKGGGESGGGGGGETSGGGGETGSGGGESGSGDPEPEPHD